VGFVTITRVSVTSDLQIARVYYTTMATGAARTDTGRPCSGPRRSCGASSPAASGAADAGARVPLRRVGRAARAIEQLIHEIHEQDAAREATGPSGDTADGGTRKP